MAEDIYYELKLEGDEGIIVFLSQHLPDHFSTIREANAKRQAIQELFGMETKLVSVKRVPAKVRRRELRI